MGRCGEGRGGAVADLIKSRLRRNLSSLILIAFLVYVCVSVERGDLIDGITRYIDVGIAVHFMVRHTLTQLVRAT